MRRLETAMRRESPEAFQRRLAIWRHNGLLGQCVMARKFAAEAQRLPTTTDASRQLAAEIEEKLFALGESLKERRPE